MEHLFDACVRHGVKFYIVTHNPNASKKNPNREWYLKIISEMTNGRIDSKSILFSSSDYGYKKCNAASAALPKLLQASVSAALPELLPPSRKTSPPSRKTSPPSRKTSPTQDYSKMNKDQLIEECNKRGIVCKKQTLKNDLIKQLTMKGGKRKTRKNYK